MLGVLFLQIQLSFHFQTLLMVVYLCVYFFYSIILIIVWNIWTSLSISIMSLAWFNTFLNSLKRTGPKKLVKKACKIKMLEKGDFLLYLKKLSMGPWLTIHTLQTMGNSASQSATKTQLFISSYFALNNISVFVKPRLFECVYNYSCRSL